MTRARFSHWIERQAGYEALLLADRRVLHRETALAIESRADPSGAAGAAGGDDALRERILLVGDRAGSLAAVAPELASHWERAAEGPRSGLYLLLAATDAERRSRYADALPACDRARERLEEADPLAGAAVSIVRARVHAKRSEFETALAGCERAEAVLEPLRATDGGAVAGLLSARAAHQRGLVLYQMSRYDEAMAAEEIALAHARRTGATREIAACLDSMGSVEWSRGDYDRALALHRESLRMRTEARDDHGIATSLANEGNVHWNRRDHDAALRCFRESLAIRRTIGDRFGVATCLNNIANVRWAGRALDEALRLHGEAIELRRGMGDRRGIAASLNNLGLVREAQGDHDEALRLHEESLAIKRELRDRYGIAVSLQNLGRIRFRQGDPAAALRRYEEALPIYREIRDAYGVASCLGNVGMARAERGEDGAALVALDEAVSRCDAATIRDILAEVLAARARVRARSGRRDDAVADAERAMRVAGETGSDDGRAAALVALGLARNDPAVAAEGVEATRALGDPIELRRALDALAEVRPAAGNT